MPKRNRAVERPMLMSVTADPPPGEVAKPAPAEWAPQNEKEFVDYFLYLLKAPTVGHPDWVDTLRDQRDKVLMERMVHHKELFAQKMCTEFEAMLYVSTVSLAYPINHDWFVIYMWLFRRWNKEKAQEIGSDDVPERLNPNQQEDLARLRQWVFKTQMLHLKKQGSVAQETVEREKQLEVERPKLF